MIDRIKAAFPLADEIATEVEGFGFARAIVVRNGDRTHALSVTPPDDVDWAIAKLRSWGAK